MFVSLTIKYRSLSLQADGPLHAAHHQAVPILVTQQYGAAQLPPKGATAPPPPCGGAPPPGPPSVAPVSSSVTSIQYSTPPAYAPPSAPGYSPPVYTPE